ncbi:hypothetical protein [Paraburkholderia sp. 32]|uniref:hypothetical protein n=1 Tax=Paraburkholderia sp. 32 TaxID=2991057 RepID=UPI003D201020
MQRIQDALVDGYTEYQMIECSLDKAKELARQFAASYETEISKQARWRRRRSGIACAKFLTLADDQTVRGVLMVTAEGKGLIRREALADANQARIQLGGYEMVHDGVSWSWRFSAATMKQWKTSIHRAIAKDDQNQLLEIIRRLYRCAGFRLVRKQVGELVNYIRGEWRRLRNGPPPPLPTFLPYIKRLPDDWSPVEISRLAA